MSCVTVRPIVEQSLSTYTDTVQQVPSTEWMPALGLGVASAALNMRNRDGNFQCRPYYETADVTTDKPNSPTAFGQAVTSSDGYANYRQSLSITSAFWVRFGTEYANSTGSSLGSADVGLQVITQACAMLFGSARFSVHPGMVTTTDINVFTATDWQPAAGIHRIMGAFTVVDNESNYLEYQLYMRTAVDTNAPNDWVAVEGSWTNPSTSNTERNTTALSVPAGADITDNVWFQLGVAFRKKSGATGNPRADIAIVSAGSYE